MIDDVRDVVDALGLPQDCVVLGRKDSHLVVGCASQRTVYRIAVADQVATGSSPSDVRRSHALAVTLHRAGLNVLAPMGSEAYLAGAYIVSASELAEPLTASGWKTDEPRALGRAMARWCAVSIPSLRLLDIPTYTAERISDARKIRGGPHGMRAASIWCERRLVRLQRKYPWAVLQRDRGCVHGDPNVGNLVRIPGEAAPLFIDLDCVATGPRYFDLAVMSMYRARFNSNYPFDEILSGYELVHGRVNRLALEALRAWKEFSSQTQLLTRWESEAVRDEFWHRTELDRDAKWVNVVNTPVFAEGTGTLFLHAES